MYQKLCRKFSAPNLQQLFYSIERDSVFGFGQAVFCKSAWEKCVERSGAGEQIRGILNYTNYHARNYSKEEVSVVLGKTRCFCLVISMCLGKGEGKLWWCCATDCLPVPVGRKASTGLDSEYKKIKRRCFCLSAGGRMWWKKIKDPPHNYPRYFPR